MFRHLLDTKQERWARLKTEAAKLMTALSHNFSGRMEYSTVETDEGLEEWFRGLASQISGLEYTDSVAAGRTIHKLIKALTDVEQFETIDTRCVLLCPRCCHCKLQADLTPCPDSATRQHVNQGVADAVP